MHSFLIFIKQMTSTCLQSLHHRFIDWTKPSTTSLLLGTVADLARSKSELVAENALLRQQLLILRRQVKRPACTKTDRMLLLLLARVVRTWKQALFIVQPETLLRWHRQGFKLFWKYKSRAASTKPRISPETVALIKEMARDNRLWGAERIRVNCSSWVFMFANARSRSICDVRALQDPEGRPGKPSYTHMPSRSGPATFSPSWISSSARCSPSSSSNCTRAK